MTFPLLFSFTQGLSDLSAVVVIQGFAHANSDVDLYLVAEQELSSQSLHKIKEREQCTFYSGSPNDYRLDIELWMLTTVDAALSKLSELDHSVQMNNLDVFNEEELNLQLSLYGL